MLLIWNGATHFVSTSNRQSVRQERHIFYVKNSIFANATGLRTSRHVETINDAIIETFFTLWFFNVEFNVEVAIVLV